MHGEAGMQGAGGRGCMGAAASGLTLLVGVLAAGSSPLLQLLLSRR
jgi:hypothetical protein